MSVRGYGHGTDGGDREVESKDEIMATLTDGGRTTLDCAAETEIVGKRAAVDLVRHMLDGGIAMIDDRLYKGTEVRNMNTTELVGSEVPAYLWSFNFIQNLNINRRAIEMHMP